MTPPSATTSWITIRKAMRCVSLTEHSLPEVWQGYRIWYLEDRVKLKLNISTCSYYQNYRKQTQTLCSKAARFYKQHTKINRRGSWHIKADHKVNTIGKVEMQIRFKCFTPIGATVNNKFQGVLGRIYEVCFPSNDSTYMTKVARPMELSYTFMYKFHYKNSQKVTYLQFNYMWNLKLSFPGRLLFVDG